MEKISLEKYRDEYLKNLGTLISYKTFLKNEKDYPTGEQLKALKFLVELGNEEGFKTFLEPKGHYAYLEIGQGKELFGILGHIDVVGPGNLKKWKTDPFKLVEKNGFIFGRGVLDDKGPMLLNFYVMKALKDSGIKLNKRIRLIIGTDEEMLWRGINKYVKNEEIPTLGYTPDGIFPVIYGEKGLLQWYAEEKINPSKFKIYGGESVNAVPDLATYEGKDSKKLIENLKKLKYHYEVDGPKINVVGQSAHAMIPEEGKNAICMLAKALDGIVDSKIVKFINSEIKMETNGATLFDKVLKDEQSGTITVTLGKLTLENGILKAWFDHRIPVFVTNKEEVEKMLQEKLNKYNLEYKYYDSLKSIYMDKSSPFIKLLMDSYNKVIGDGLKPYTIGGATYARAIDNVVAFGPMIQSDRNLEHQSNEEIRIESLENAFKIYYDVLIKINSQS